MVDKLGIPKGNVLHFQLCLENTGGIIAALLERLLFGPFQFINCDHCSVVLSCFDEDPYPAKSSKVLFANEI